MVYDSKTETIFNYIDRNYKKTIVLFPGWASDYRIFNLLDLEYNYLLPIKLNPFLFENFLFEEIKKNKLKKISILGWSLGGSLAVEFALKYPDCINELILVSIRVKYSEQVISQIKKYLRKNKKIFLYSFYNQCFFDKDSGKWFKENLLKSYCEDLVLSDLLEGLDYLKKEELNFKKLKGVKKIKIIHGEQDNIAPIEEARGISNQLSNSKFISIKGGGHMPFFEDDFSKYVF
ncbi:MAG: alpha/beta hydrolase [Candidatus Omnitrophica bacterium]|nr:alpha/beta hydrolase [Candidatus Omnitrophota bacterium]